MFGNPLLERAKPLRVLFAATLSVSVLSVATVASAQENNPIGGLPQALICTKDSVTVVGYLARINADGSAVYMTPSNIIVEVSADGVVANRSDGSCAGKGLDELRDGGQTREFRE